MQVGSKPVTVMLTVHDQTGVPGKATILDPVAFAAFQKPGRGLREDSAYVTGGGPGGTNATRKFWMTPTVADAFKAACHAALMDGNHYAVTFA